MPDLQKHFLKFHDNIKLGNYDENQNLRDKRDTLLSNLKDNIDEDAPTFESFDQGSYAMHTGNNPADGNYDIDVGIVFDCTEDDYDDPVELKKLVRDALTHGNRSVTIRRPCVTVEYMKNDKVDYHVDLAIYVKRNWDTLLNLTKGKEFSDEDNRLYEKSDPKGLIDKINNCCNDADDKAQMRRCIRYLKRWRDKISNYRKPFSIALTCAAYHWFIPKKDAFTGKYVDIAALLSLVEIMFNNFSILDRLSIDLPVEPYGDLNEKMTDNQMQEFKEKIEALRDALRTADDEDLEEDACKLLRKQFGDEFPVPEKKTTAKVVATAGFAPAGGSA